MSIIQMPTRTGARNYPVVLTSLVVGPVHEEVHRADLGDPPLRAVQPQHLLAVMFLQSLDLNVDCGRIVPEV